MATGSHLGCQKSLRYYPRLIHSSGGWGKSAENVWILLITQMMRVASGIFQTTYICYCHF